MSAEILKFRKSLDPDRAGEELIDHAYAGLVYCLAGFPDPLPVHRFEAMEVDSAAHRVSHFAPVRFFFH